MASNLSHYDSNVVDFSVSIAASTGPAKNAENLLDGCQIVGPFASVEKPKPNVGSGSAQAEF
jgi:hypothetical protein